MHPRRSQPQPLSREALPLPARPALLCPHLGPACAPNAATPRLTCNGRPSWQHQQAQAGRHRSAGAAVLVLARPIAALVGGQRRIGCRRRARARQLASLGHLAAHPLGLWGAAGERPTASGGAPVAMLCPLGTTCSPACLARRPLEPSHPAAAPAGPAAAGCLGRAASRPRPGPAPRSRPPLTRTLGRWEGTEEAEEQAAADNAVSRCGGQGRDLGSSRAGWQLASPAPAPLEHARAGGCRSAPGAVDHVHGLQPRGGHLGERLIGVKPAGSPAG